MSFERKSAGNTARRVLADSANAKHRFGFAGKRGSPILGAPKLSDLWYLEFNTVTDGGLNSTAGISSLAKSVSPISIQMSNMPVDQYGKRVYVPTRVDFPEVSITMHDTVDGKMFGVAQSIYSKFFKNQKAKVSGANAEQVLTDSHAYGRKIPDSKHEYYHQHFEKITIYHFFGNLDSYDEQEVASGFANGASKSFPENAGAGTLQKIELINPLVTNITFSLSDYASSELRTIDLSIQPENIIIGQVDEDVAFPDWMSWGMDYMQHKLSPHLKRIKGNIYPDKFAEGPRNEQSRFKKKSRADGTEEWVDAQGNKRTNEFGDDEHKRTQAESLVDPLRIEEQEYKDTTRKLNELMKLYNISLRESGPAGGPLPEGEKAANNEALAEALKRNIGVIDLARSKRFSANSKIPKNQFDTPYVATYKNPDIPTFGGIGDSNPPKNMFPSYSTDIGDALVQELISSFFNKTKFDASNIKQAFVNKMIGATGFPMNMAIDGKRIIDGAKGSAQGAYQTTVKANESVVTKTPVVHKTNNTELPMGMSKAILRKILNN